jgi:hypothetical protein
MNEIKYYTPNPSEFHIGFECELEKNKEWIPVKLKCVQEIWEAVDKLNWGVRVKILDASDIISLGFTKSEEVTTPYVNFTTYIKNNIYLHMFNSGIIEIIVDDESRCKNADGSFNKIHLFRGYIKNKSELVKFFEMFYRH